MSASAEGSARPSPVACVYGCGRGREGGAVYVGAGVRTGARLRTWQRGSAQCACGGAGLALSLSPPPAPRPPVPPHATYHRASPQARACTRACRAGGSQRLPRSQRRRNHRLARRQSRVYRGSGVRPLLSHRSGTRRIQGVPCPWGETRGESGYTKQRATPCSTHLILPECNVDGSKLAHGIFGRAVSLDPVQTHSVTGTLIPVLGGGSGVPPWPPP